MQRGISAALEASRRCVLQGERRFVLQALSELGCAPSRSFSTAAAQKPEKWGVQRTPNGNLPVYRDIRNHNTREITIIRKVIGDLNELRAQFLREFEVTADRVWVKQGRVEIKGFHRPEVIAWLESKGF